MLEIYYRGRARAPDTERCADYRGESLLVDDNCTHAPMVLNGVREIALRGLWHHGVIKRVWRGLILPELIPCWAPPGPRSNVRSFCQTQMREPNKLYAHVEPLA